MSQPIPLIAMLRLVALPDELDVDPKAVIRKVLAVKTDPFLVALLEHIFDVDPNDRLARPRITGLVVGGDSVLCSHYLDLLGNGYMNKADVLANAIGIAEVAQLDAFETRYFLRIVRDVVTQK